MPMESVKITIDGMTCGHCVKAVEVELSELAVNILGVKVGSAEVRFDQTKVKREEIEEAVKNAGFTVVSIEEIKK